MSWICRPFAAGFYGIDMYRPMLEVAFNQWTFTHAVDIYIYIYHVYARICIIYIYICIYICMHIHVPVCCTVCLVGVLDHVYLSIY